jgi:Domain of unknown function (DUF4185)
MQTRISFVRATLCALCLSYLALISPSPGAASADLVPPPIPPVESVTDLGIVAQNGDIYARDGAVSALIGGRSVWTFGDTALAVPGTSGKHWDDNSASWTTDLDASNGITLDHDLLDNTGAPAEFLPLTDAEQRYNDNHDPDHCTANPCGAEFALWAGPPVADPARHRALFFYAEIWRIAGQSSWKYVGTGIAVGTLDGGVVRPVVNPGSPAPTLMWGAKQVGFGGGALVLGQTLYAYGCTAQFLTMHCDLARVPLAGVLNPTQWRYYAGNGRWSADQADAVTVFDGGAAGNSVFFNPYLGEFMAIYSGVFSDDVFYRVSYTPWGPWSGQALLFTGKPGWQNNSDYAAEAHTEFAQANGKFQYVTYVHTTGFLRMELPLVQVVFGQPTP